MANQARSGGGGGAGAQRDPLVQAIQNTEVIDITSTLVAKLERAAFYTDKQQGHVFRTAWARRLFDEVVRRMQPNARPPFDIDAWHAQQDARRSPDVNKKLSPSLVIQHIGAVDWVAPLFELETRLPGFMVVLHNVLSLEDMAFTKLTAAATEAANTGLLDVGAPMGVRQSRALVPGR